MENKEIIKNLNDILDNLNNDIYFNIFQDELKQDKELQIIALEKVIKGLK